ncbi:MAG TPA: hypothetical protein V6D31_10655 [Candidatus Sericytochromatia bacterium]
MNCLISGNRVSARWRFWRWLCDRVHEQKEIFKLPSYVAVPLKKLLLICNLKVYSN